MKISRDPSWFKQPKEVVPHKINVNDIATKSIHSNSEVTNKIIKHKVGNCLIKCDSIQEFALAMKRSHITFKILDFFPVSGFFSLDLYMISDK